MIRSIVGLILGGSLMAAVVAPAVAQAVPQGSYQQTCSNARVSGDRLEAECTDAGGYLVRTSIDLDSCRSGDIGNVDGNLRCLPRNQNVRPDNRTFENGGLPSGSYQQSCNNVSFQAGRLSATCSNPNGQPIASSLDIDSCRPDSDIVTVYGRLACASNAVASPGSSALVFRSRRPENNAFVDGRRPAIEAQFGQLQADPDTIRVRLDDRDVTNETTRTPRSIAFSPAYDLQPGQHMVRVSGRDANGRPFDQTWQFTTRSVEVSNFIDDLQPAENALVPNSIVVSGRTQPHAHLVVQLTGSGDQRPTLNGVIGQLLGVGGRPNAVRVETDADGNGYFSVQVDIDAGSGQQLGLVVDSTEPRTQAAAHTSRTLVVR